MPSAAQRTTPTVAITPHTFKLTEHGVSLSLTVVDTPGPTRAEMHVVRILSSCAVIVGFGDAVDNSTSYVNRLFLLKKNYLII